MSGVNRKKYLTATVLNQDLLDWCADNLECKIEMVAEIETPTGTIYASDRNKYVGSRYYRALLVFPTISRTIGDWLAPDLQFSSLELSLNNSTGEFNNFLPGGEDFGGWLGKKVEVKIGIAEIQSSYKTIFRGFVTDIGGFKRTTKTIVVIARDRFDTINASFPKTTFTKSAFPKLSENVIGKIVPIIYGSFLEYLEPDPAIVTTFCVNGADPMVNRKDKVVAIYSGNPATFECNEHGLIDDDQIKFSTSGALPSGMTADTKYYVINSTGNLTFQISETQGGSAISTTDPQSGVHKFIAHDDAGYRNAQFVISHNDLKYLDTENIYLLRSEFFSLVPLSEISNIGSGNKSFEISQKTGTSWVAQGDGTNIEFAWESNDIICVRCVGEDLGAYTDNIVEQARHIIKTYGGLTSGDFNSTWDTIRDWNSPAESNIAGFKSRIWIGEQQSALQYCLSLLEQVRLEAFINKNQDLVLSSLHFDKLAFPSETIKNWDIEEGSFQTSVSEQTNFNRAQGVYNYSPLRAEQSRTTLIYKNQAAIDQTGKQISKQIEFPNLYREADTEINLKEILKLASATIEIISFNATWRLMLAEIGQFYNLNINIGSVVLNNVPCLVREVGVDPAGLKIPVKLWSFQMCPYPLYEPDYEGIVGGFDAIIEAD